MHVVIKNSGLRFRHKGAIISVLEFVRKGSLRAMTETKTISNKKEPGGRVRTQALKHFLFLKECFSIMNRQFTGHWRSSR